MRFQFGALVLMASGGTARRRESSRIRPGQCPCSLSASEVSVGTLVFRRVPIFTGAIDDRLSGREPEPKQYLQFSLLPSHAHGRLDMLQSKYRVIGPDAKGNAPSPPGFLFRRTRSNATDIRRYRSRLPIEAPLGPHLQITGHNVRRDTAVCTAVLGTGLIASTVYQKEQYPANL
jgi:hypothetical protein